MDKEAAGQVNQLELLQGGVDLQLGGGEGRHTGLRGHRHIHTCKGKSKVRSAAHALAEQESWDPGRGDWEKTEASLLK